MDEIRTNTINSNNYHTDTTCIQYSDNIISIVVLIIEGIQLIVLLASIVPVEKALKKTFDENGVRR